MTSAVLPQTAHSAPFDALAEAYDEVFTNSRIGRAQRNSVWRVMDSAFLPGQRVLELNCGTGVDALHLAERGVSVLACDVSPRMIAVAERRLEVTAPRPHVVFRVLATEEIASLRGVTPFDGAFSNFSGLNCVADLSAVARDLACLVRPGARAILCVFGAFAAWEVAWYLSKGEARKALRRFRKGGVPVRLVADRTVPCRYPTVRTLARIFAPEFRLRRWKGVGVSVPPTYLDHFASRFPRFMSVLEWADPWLGCCPVVRGLADHMVLEFERCQE